MYSTQTKGLSFDPLSPLVNESLTKKSGHWSHRSHTVTWFLFKLNIIQHCDLASKINLLIQKNYQTELVTWVMAFCSYWYKYLPNQLLSPSSNVVFMLHVRWRTSNLINSVRQTKVLILEREKLCIWYSFY